MGEMTPLRDLVEELCANGKVTAQDVLQLRRQVFPDGVVSDVEAAAVFRADQSCREKDPEWTRFYVDVLTDFFVWQSVPRGYVSQEQADYLIGEVGRDGHIDAMSELELLINIVHWSTECPESLALLALQAVKESVVSPGTACYGSNRPPAVIGAADVELIRKLIYAPGSPGGFTVTRGEAELLIDLDKATRAEENAQTWPDLFAKGVANALMFPRGAPVVPSASEARRRERWLEERRGVGALLAGVGKALTGGDIPFGEAGRAFDPFGTHRAREERQQEEALVKEALAREAIDAEEARWLVGRLGDPDTLSEGAVKLLRFIKENAPHIDPALTPLLEKVAT